MEISSWNGLAYFLWSVTGGLGLALVYDIIRTVRRASGPSVLTVCLWDIIFIIFFGVLLLYTAYDKNGGQLRIQGFVGTIGSFILYRCIFKNFIVNLFIKIYELFIRLVIFLLRIFLFPIRIFYKIIEKPFFAVADLGEKNASKLKSRLRVLKKRKAMQKKMRKPSKSKQITE